MPDSSEPNDIASIWKSTTRWVMLTIVGAAIGDLFIRHDDAAVRWLLSIFPLHDWWFTSMVVLEVLTIAFFVLLTVAGVQVHDEDVGIWEKRCDELLDILEGSQKSFDVMLAIANLQASYLLNIDSVALNPSLASLRAALVELMRDCSTVLHHQVVRSYILVPNGDYLETFVEEQMPPALNYARRFYIGDDDHIRRGVAGEVFRSQAVRVVHVLETDEGLVHDDPAFLVLDPADRDPGYRSFICVPIGYRGERCGVYCIDSPQVDLFDDEEVQQHLVFLGGLIGRMLVLVQTMGIDIAVDGGDAHDGHHSA